MGAGARAGADWSTGMRAEVGCGVGVRAEGAGREGWGGGRGRERGLMPHEGGGLREGESRRRCVGAAGERQVGSRFVLAGIRAASHARNL